MNRNAMNNRTYLQAQALVLESGAADQIILTAADIPRLREISDQLMPAAYGLEGTAAIREAEYATH